MDQRARFGRDLLTLAALAFTQMGCGEAETRSATSSISAGSNATPAKVNELEFVTMSVAGGLCSPHNDCWDKRTVRRDNELELEDSQGTQTFAISAEEFSHVEQLTQSAEFDQKVADSLAGTDCGGFDIGISMRFQRRNAEAVDVKYVDSCALSPQAGESPKILNQVIVAMDALKMKYLTCPPREQPRGWNSAFDPLPQRASCWNCYKCSGGNAADAPMNSPASVPMGGTMARDAGPAQP